MLTTKLILKPLLIAGAAVFTVLAAPMAVDYLVDDDSTVVTQAMAEEGGGPPPGKGGRPDGKGGRPEGKGGPGDRAKGPPVGESDYWSSHDTWPPAAKGSSGSAGGKPAWASKELVDIGRMNVARAPASVLAKAEDGGLTELLAALTPSAENPVPVNFYTAALAILKDPTILDKEAAIAALLRDPTVVRVDSPLSNLAFYKDILTGDYKVTLADGTVIFDGTNETDRLLLASIFLASSADKTSVVTAEVVHAVDTIFELGDQVDAAGVNSDAAMDGFVAEAADDVLQAIELVHDE